jgi:hypothetical protein
VGEFVWFKERERGLIDASPGCATFKGAERLNGLFVRYWLIKFQDLNFEKEKKDKDLFWEEKP